MKVILLLSAILLGCWNHAFAAKHQRYENLNNPTEYSFSAPSAEIIKVLKDKHGPNSWGPLGAGFRGDVYGMGIYDYYTNRYWNGPRERKEDIDPPEAGLIGTIQATFEVKVIAKGENRTIVSVTVKSFEQQVGRRYRISPHLHKGPIIVTVKSDTYFEYLFLRQLGELLGEKNMPPLKGAAE